MDKHDTQSQQGFIVGSLLVLIIIISFLLLTITSSAVSNFQIATKDNTRVNAQMAADSGLDIGIVEINLDETWPGTGPVWDGSNWAGSISEVELLNDGETRTTYEVTVTDGVDPDSEKTIRAVGRSYKPASSTVPSSTRIFELEARAVTSGISGAGVVAGVGGLYMNNNSKITGGDVIVGGFIEMSNQAQIGLSTTPVANAVNVWVSHFECPTPADSAFLVYCSDPPIELDNNARIYGDVQANNQPMPTADVTNPGVTVTSGVPPVTVPVYDRTTHGSWGSSGTSSAAVGCPSNNGTRTWSAGLKINGDVDMKNRCTITVNGDVWITGSWETGNQGRIVVPESAGLTRPVIMIDGQNGFELQNNGQVIPNSFGTGIEVRTFWSTDSCTTAEPPATPCTSISGSDTIASQDEETIDLGNNGQANNSVFIAQFSQVKVSNNGVLGAISGQSIELSNQAVINFTASVPGSDNLSKTWVKRGYLRVFQ